MYIVDTLHAIVHGPHALDRLDVLPARVKAGRTLAEDILANAELYAFDPSALQAVGDVRVDTADRLLRAIEAVTRSPRRVFVETDGALRKALMPKLRGEAGDTAAVRGMVASILGKETGAPARAGIDISVVEPGVLRLRDVWLGPRSSGRGVGDAFGRKTTRLEKKLAEQHARLGFSLPELEIDVRNATPSAPTPEAIGAFSDIGLDRRHLTRMAEMGNTMLSITHLLPPHDWLAEAWMEHSGEMEGSGRALLAASLSMGYEVLYAVAMLATLDARSDAIVRTPRGAGQGRKAARCPKTIDAFRAEGLTTVKLDLSDAALTQALAQTAGGAAPAAGSSGRKSPVRHPVRGHLFLARNGEFVYRSPHWRGSGPGAVVHHVFDRSRK